MTQGMHDQSSDDLWDHAEGPPATKNQLTTILLERQEPVRLYSRVHRPPSPFPTEATTTIKHQHEVLNIKQDKQTIETIGHLSNR